MAIIILNDFVFSAKLIFPHFLSREVKIGENTRHGEFIHCWVSGRKTELDFVHKKYIIAKRSIFDTVLAVSMWGLGSASLNNFALYHFPFIFTKPQPAFSC